MGTVSKELILPLRNLIFIKLSYSSRIFIRQNMPLSNFEVVISDDQGNQDNSDEPDEPVLGYFIVAGISQKRIFIDRPKELSFYYNTACFLITDDLTTVLWTLPREEWPVYLTAKFGEFTPSPALPSRQRCIDCTENGGVLTTPKFWEE